MALVFGTVQRRDTLDHVAAALSTRPPAQMQPRVLAALRLGLYELLYLDGAPARAVVSDAVALAKATPHGDRPARGGHNLVNAVLRRAVGDGPKILHALSDATAAQAAVAHSHPLWLAQLWWQELGPDAARALMAADNRPAETALRANTLVCDAPALVQRLDVPCRLDGLVSEAVVVDGPFDAHGSPLWSEGAFTAQSRAAMLVARVLDPQPGERVLDLCAAPGGKTTHIAALMGDRGEVVAVERHSGRAAALERTCRRMHAASVAVRVGDAAREQGGGFHRVLVDPPCSGLGTLQARPDLRWRTTPDAIAQMAPEQAAILAAGAAALRDDGVLVYSTCTISPTENEQQVLAFLREHPDFVADDLSSVLPDHQHPRAPGSVLTLPSRDGTAGFFIARLRRTGSRR